jgi:amino acid transporter
VLCLIPIGSTIAFNIIVSLSTVSLSISYIFVISCILRRRLCKEPLLPSKFDLGRFGVVVNTIAICYLTLAVVFLFFPSVPNPTPMDMNWTCVIFGCLCIFSMAYYFIYGRYHYVGPVEYVKKL